MKKYIFFFALIFLISSCQQKIGGQKDDYGCLTGAGYSWDENITACVRPWELDGSQRKAAQMVVAPMSARPVTIISVETLECQGCFIVNIKVGDEGKTYPVKLIGWKVSYEITSFDECAAAGNPIMESYPRRCSAGDKTFTEEIKPSSPDEHICTEEEKAAEACTMDYTPVCGKLVLNTGEIIYQTYGNGCSACSNTKVVSYKKGECKESMKYLSKSPEECSRMGVWQCDAGYSLFSDETGCGCKEAVSPEKTGLLSGKINIGPLCPVERDPPDPNCEPTIDTYKAWPIAVYDSNNVKVDTVTADKTGSFILELPAGEYTLDLEEKQGLGRGNLPEKVTIKAGETTETKIEVDTGMR